MKISLLFLLTVLLSVACVRNGKEHDTENVQGNSAQTFVYECSDLEFVALIEGEAAWLFLPGETVSLAHISAASGARYRNEATQFWSKGEEAMLEWNGKQHNRCRNNRTRAIWEHAKLNGVDFRAVGNEPGWVLELRDNNGSGSISFVTDYGSTGNLFPSIERKTEGSARRTIYHAQSGEQQIKLVLEGLHCNDSMADISYETTVTVFVDDREFRGCGRALH